MNIIKNKYQHAGKCGNQENLKDGIDAAMVSNPEDVTYESSSLPMTSIPVKKSFARKSLCLFTNIFDVKNKTAKHRVGTAKSKHRAIKVGNSLWTNLKK